MTKTPNDSTNSSSETSEASEACEASVASVAGDTSSNNPADQVCFKDIIELPEILKSLDNNNFTIPTPVQAAAVPPALNGKDLIVQSSNRKWKNLGF